MAKMAAPPPPPPPPITPLPPSDKEYTRLTALVPQGRVVTSIRRCRVGVRQAEYEKEKGVLSTKGALERELGDVCHGTPDVWRSTSIALNGFDEKIFGMHGLAWGRGVYSVYGDMSTPNQYAGASGSILVMNGLVHPDAFSPTCKQNLGGNASNPPAKSILVWQHTKQIVPTHIVDFGPDTGLAVDPGAAAREAAAREAAAKVEKANKLAEQMKKEEDAFAKAAYDDGQKAVDYYTARLRDFERTYKSGSSDAAREELRNRFEREKRQFDDGLPVYAAKEEVRHGAWRQTCHRARLSARVIRSRLTAHCPSMPAHCSFMAAHSSFIVLPHLCAQLIAKLKTHQVLIVTAPTGSGKSTQLPQYVLDHVLGPDETRQVAVLQPRRVNASALCQRVAEERGVVAGGEVGYTVGRGEEQASSETRIRFMTHGLFVQLAKDPTRFARRALARTSAPAGDQQDGAVDGAVDPSAAAAEESVGYAAVILDEAHERSAEIDMSLALIKRLVEATDVRVIITSATIGSSKEKFRNFLREGPGKPLPEVVELSGRTYPVFVNRCDLSMMTGAAAGSADASLHDKTSQLGFAGVGKVLCQVALQQAVELLQSSKTDGNVLVFMPGEGDINRALGFCRSRFSYPSDTSATTFGRSGISFYLDVDADADSAGAAVQRGGGGRGGGSRRRQILVGIHPFHGKLTSAERDAVLNPREDRVIVFTTNYAETGTLIALDCT